MSSKLPTTMAFGGAVALGLGAIAALLKASTTSTTRRHCYARYASLAQRDFLMNALDRLQDLLVINGTEPGPLLQPVCDCIEIIARYDDGCESRLPGPAMSLHFVSARLDTFLLAVLEVPFRLPQLGQDICNAVDDLTVYRDRVLKNVYLATITPP